MHVQLRFFASLREALGHGERLDLPGPCTVAELRDRLIARGGPHAAALARTRTLRAARNQQLCDEAVTLADGDELAFFPPVTGG
jgi:molybdopterin synthase sulfur carrier subunit